MRTREKVTCVNILTEAIRVLNKFGWVQERFGNEDVGFCAIGGIYKAAKNLRIANDAVYGFKLEDEASKVLRQDEFSFPNFNDELGTTKNDVIKLMRRIRNRLNRQIRSAKV